MVDVQTIGVLATAVSVSVAAIYFIFTLRISQKNMKSNLDTRQAQLFMQIFQRFQEPEFTRQWSALMNTNWSDTDDYYARINLDPDHASNRLSVQTYFEGVAVLLMKNMIDVDFVYELMPTMVTTFWKKYEPVVKRGREVASYPQWFRPVEYLSDRMVEQAMKRGDPVVTSYKGISKDGG